MHFVSHKKRGKKGDGERGLRKARKEGEEKGTLSPQSSSFFPFLPIPYPFRRLLRKLVVLSLRKPTPLNLEACSQAKENNRNEGLLNL